MLSQNCEKGQLTSSCLSVCLSVCPSAWNKSAPTGQILIFEVFVKSVEKMPVLLKSDINASALHTDLCNLMIIPRLVLLRMRNGPDESCRENQHMHFM